MKNKHFWYILGGIVIATLILLIIFANVNKQPNCKIIQTPYEEQESYIDYETYNEQNCEESPLTYTTRPGDIRLQGGRWGDDSCSKNGLNQCLIVWDVIIKNTDTRGGEFYMYCIYSDGSTYKATRPSWIDPGEEESMQCFNTFSSGELYIQDTKVFPPNKEECLTTSQQRPITKYRTITKYKEETVCD